MNTVSSTFHTGSTGVDQVDDSALDTSIANAESTSALLAAFIGLPVVGMDEASLRGVLRSTARLKGSLAALACKVGAEADRLAAQGCSAPADEVLANGGQLRSRTAKRQAARSRAVSEIAGLSDAMSSGDVGSDHIDSLAHRLKKLTPDERSKIDDARLVDKARRLSADRFDKAVKDEVDRVRGDHGLKDTLQKRQASEFHHWFDHKTGMGKFSGQLDPERYEAFTLAIDQHVTTLTTSSKSARPTTKDAALAAAALAELVCTSPNRSKNLPHVTIVVDHKTLADGGHSQTVSRTGNGHDLPPETIGRLACDSVLQRVVLDERQLPVNVGRKHRTATDTQWAAIRAVTSTCAWPDCDRPLSWCQLHHITEWRKGGPTDLDNLVPLCSTHHHRVHEGKWSIKLRRDRTLAIWKANGEQLHHRIGSSTRPKLNPRPTPSKNWTRSAVERAGTYERLSRYTTNF